MMNHQIIMGSLFISLAITTFAQDPAVTDGEKYKIILENESVRVLDYQDKPGQKTTRHHHPNFVLYALDSFKRKLTFGNGKQVERQFKKGDVIWMKDQIHIGENIGSTNTHVLIVELKHTRPDSVKKPEIPNLEKKWKSMKDSNKKPE